MCAFTSSVKKGKLPFILQVRALEGFKKGSLVLAPAYRELLRKDSDAQHQLVRGQGVVHTAMLSHVEVNLTVANGDRRRRDEDRPKRTTEFIQFSPLLAGKAAKNRHDCIQNIVPFWALLRSVGPRAFHNMELDVLVFRDHGFDVVGSQYPRLPQGVEFTVQIPIARNVAHVSKGDVLCLPCFDPVSSSERPRELIM